MRDFLDKLHTRHETGLYADGYFYSFVLYDLKKMLLLFRIPSLEDVIHRDDEVKEIISELYSLQKSSKCKNKHLID